MKLVPVLVFVLDVNLERVTLFTLQPITISLEVRQLVSTSKSFLRVLIEPANDDSIYVATCLETGNVATASSYEKARTMIKEVLQDEYSSSRNNLRNLFRSPINQELVKRFEKAVEEFGSIEEPLFPQEDCSSKGAPVEFSKLPNAA